MSTQKYDFVLLIGTLQYIEDWRSIFLEIHRNGADNIYIHRTPFTTRDKGFVVVQSVVPATVGVKAGEENLNVISWNEFIDAVGKSGWSVKKIGPRQDYSANFARLEKGYRNAFYQRVLLKRR